jgi:hypothetical protein
MKKKKFKVIKGSLREPNLFERNTMTQRIDATLIEAICRVLGRTDWAMDAAMFKRGKWRYWKEKTKYEEQTFYFDGKELFVVRPWAWSIPHDAWIRKVEWLFDKEDYQHHTKEDEAG